MLSERQERLAGATETDSVRLVAALRRGEPGAGHQLVRSFSPLVERLVAGALGPDSELADVVHDVFVRAFESLDNQT